MKNVAQSIKTLLDALPPAGVLIRRDGFLLCEAKVAGRVDGAWLPPAEIINEWTPVVLSRAEYVGWLAKHTDNDEGEPVDQVTFSSELPPGIPQWLTLT